LECDGHFFSAVDIVLENLSGSVLVAEKSGSVKGMDAKETITDYNSAPLAWGKTAPLKNRKGAAPPL
jgi:hypothetical protein